MKCKMGSDFIKEVFASGLMVLLFCGMIAGCAGTLESDETVETNNQSAEKSPKEPEVDEVSNEETKPPEANLETQPGANEGATQVTCGDPAIAAKYEECKKAKEEQSCLAAGGNWTRVGLSPVSMCLCSTGQEECPCETSADCLSTCIAPLDMNNWECSPKRHCSAVDKTAGCWCRYHKDGSVRKMCVD